MKRFNFDDEYHEEGYGSDSENEFEGIPDEYHMMMEEQGRQINMQVAIAHRELNQKLLFRVIKMLEKSFLWKFRSQNTKIRKITEMYFFLKDITEDELFNDEMEEE